MGGQKPITSLAIFLSIAEQLLEIRIINYSRRLTLAKKCGLVYKYCCSVFLLVTLFATVSFFFLSGIGLIVTGKHLLSAPFEFIIRTLLGTLNKHNHFRL